MISEVKGKLDILELKEKPLFSLGNKAKNETIIFYDKDSLDKSIENYFNTHYKNLLYIIMSINSSDDATDSDTELVLIKIDDLRKYLLNNFGKYLNNTLLNRYLKMLNLLETKINMPVKGKSR